jgi:hypothetical protein
MTMRQWEASSPPFYKCNLPPHAITVIKEGGATLKIDGLNEIGCPYWRGRTKLCQNEDCLWRREDGANECWQILGLVHKLSYNCERDAHWSASCSIHSKQSYVGAHCSSLKPFSSVAAYKSEAGWLDGSQRQKVQSSLEYTEFRNLCFSLRNCVLGLSIFHAIFLFDHQVFRLAFRPILYLRNSV